MKTVFLLLPGLSEKYRGGGTNVALDFLELINRLDKYNVHVVVYNEKLKNTIHISELEIREDDILIVTWGLDAGKHLERFHGKCRCIYFAQSFGWNMRVAEGIPIICVSRFVMGRWAQRNPHNPIFYLPPIVEVKSNSDKSSRDIDVLILHRKMSHYLSNSLANRLKEEGVYVKEISEFTDKDSVLELFARSKVYLYSSREHRHRGHNWVEGFGLQPLEALFSGCVVFSNLHGGLSDHQDPGASTRQLEVNSLGHDVDRIVAAVRDFRPTDVDESLRRRHSRAEIEKKIRTIMAEIELSWDYAPQPDAFGAPSRWRRRLERKVRAIFRIRTVK